MKKCRADLLAVARGLCETQNEAQRLIMAGRLRSGRDHIIRKPSAPLTPDSPLSLTEISPYVSRGGEKLAAATACCQESFSGKIALDIGASTGGFTDLLLQYGASRVYAVDVGYGQLHLRLRRDSRVVCLERVNARYLDEENIPEKIEILTADVSFISLRRIIPPATALLAPKALIFLLVKPQFEAKRHEVGRNGVIADEKIQKRCVEEIITFTNNKYGWKTLAVTPSPLTGPKGNQEYILTMKAPEKSPGAQMVDRQDGAAT